MKLKQIIDKRLKQAGFTEKEGVNAPFFVLGDFANNSLCVDVYGQKPAGLMDRTIEAVNVPARVDNGEFVVHAVTEKKTLRVNGKKLFKVSMTFIFKFNVIEEAE